MKNVAILFLAFTACGQQSKSGHNYVVSSDAPPMDLMWLQQTVADLNAHLGCEYFTLTVGDKPLDASDSNPYQTYSFISFTNDAKTATALGDTGNVLNSILGIEQGYPIDAANDDILLVAFSTADLKAAGIYVRDIFDRHALATYTATHEFGHALGLTFPDNPTDLVHSLNYDDIMNAYENLAANGGQVQTNGITDAQWARYVNKAWDVGVCSK